jgi:hypothetical protein
MQKVIEATPQVIDTIQKANKLVNSSTISDQMNGPISSPYISEGVMASAEKMVPAKVLAGNGLIGYRCEIYKNGLSEPPTDVGTVFLANGASTIYALPAGTIIFVQKFVIDIHGGPSN